FFCKRDQACAHYVLGSQPTATKCRCRRFESAPGARWIGFSEDDATTARRSRKVRIDEINQAAVPHLPTRSTLFSKFALQVPHSSGSLALCENRSPSVYCSWLLSPVYAVRNR